jgi:hypothetical protein
MASTNVEKRGIPDMPKNLACQLLLDAMATRPLGCRPRLKPQPEELRSRLSGTETAAACPDRCAAEPERRGEPVEISAFLHVAQQVSTDEHPQPDTGSAAGCLATCRGTRSAVTALHHWVDQLVSTLPKEAVRRCQRRSGARWWCSPRRAATG